MSNFLNTVKARLSPGVVVFNFLMWKKTSQGLSYFLLSNGLGLKIGSSQQRVAVHHAVPAEVMHRDHSILINNRLVVKSSTGSSSDTKNSTKSSSAIRKTVFYNPNNAGKELYLFYHTGAKTNFLSTNYKGFDV